MRESDVLDLIYGVLAAPDQWPNVLTGVSDYLGAIGGMIAHCAVRGESFLITGRLSDECGDLYLKQHASNCWTDRTRFLPPGQAAVASSLVDERELRKTAFYADILAPQGIVNGLGANHISMMVDGGVGGFVFMLSERGNDKAQEGLENLQRLVPHLNRALDAGIQIGRYRQHGPQFETILQAMPQAAFLLDGRGGVLYANPAAETLLQSGDGLVYRDRRLTAALSDECTAFARWIEGALSAASGTAGTLYEPLRLMRPSGKPALVMMPVPLPPPVFPLWELLDRARLLLNVIDPVSQRLAAAVTVEKAFGLTPAQARVAVLVGAGLSAPQAAAALGLSLPTVKTHLAHSFEKIGINSQAALVKLLASLPADPSNSEPIQL